MRSYTFRKEVMLSTNWADPFQQLSVFATKKCPFYCKPILLLHVERARVCVWSQSSTTSKGLQQGEPPGPEEKSHFHHFHHSLLLLVWRHTCHDYLMCDDHDNLGVFGCLFLSLSPSRWSVCLFVCFFILCRGTAASSARCCLSCP